MEETNKENIAEKDLETVSGGCPHDAGACKRRYMRATTPYQKSENARQYLEALGLEVSFQNPKYPCPVCGS